MKNFVEELRWRGMIHDITPGAEEQLLKEMVSGYVGIDPTADSLHIGHLVGVMMLVHLQRSGHRPIALVGGATGMIGDPSGKSQERNLLSEKVLRDNENGLKKQLAKFLDFKNGDNKALLVNNYDWMKDYTFLDFIREIGKHLTVNYMMAKDSVKKRISTDSKSGMSFTEFSYQLVQGTDFLHLYQNNNCKLQMGGSDQWGNIITGTELIRRKLGHEHNVYAITCPLITKADGSKFGKTESGNVWLDPEKTSPYEFYQFWLNVSDEDAEKYIKIFTLFSESDIEAMIEEHKNAPHLRYLQNELAKDITCRVHGTEDYNKAIEASQILFGKGTTEMLMKIDEKTLLSIFKGVPQSEISKEEFEMGIGLLDFLSIKAGAFKSNGEARRMIKDNAVSINKSKINEGYELNSQSLINNKYILVQKGKKNYFLVKVV
ncbi:MAG: tyrosine--tRNA ligase [Lentimicrobiaceae bacterium]|jgi:tyrosyl-tRNA synthetase|nr:tyrosine--tRNA ligase [Lentimicrobiaceae bacterium]MCP4909080.1 tyrosine--tRNA ligase [Bacteroidota bacterium]MBT3453404.1 tyrosine--tRNA ligase [Lentimicrobiaceae bacterium]MBT3819038.1 tyrosine--tRNA ligase [Lentimicrobiaceae bacterium]MBT4061986.1 tyrosine--tRNA ligase [Lentimicrobiaceae bacterium]